MSSTWWWWEKDFSARGSHLPQAVGGWQDGEERKGAKRDFTSLYWVICTVCLHAEEYSCAHLFHLLICARVFKCRTLLQQQVQRHVGPLMFDRKTLILQCCLIILVMLCLKFDWCGRAIGSPAWLCLVRVTLQYGLIFRGEERWCDKLEMRNSACWLKRAVVSLTALFVALTFVLVAKWLTVLAFNFKH